MALPQTSSLKQGKIQIIHINDNFFETVKEGLHFNKFELNDTNCLEYTRPIENEQRAGLCSQSDYLV